MAYQVKNIERMLNLTGEKYNTIVIDVKVRNKSMKVFNQVKKIPLNSKKKKRNIVYSQF